VVVARPDDSSHVVINIKRLPQREGGERCSRPILAKYIGGSRNWICGESRAPVWRAGANGVGRGSPPHFGGILAVNFKLCYEQNSKKYTKIQEIQENTMR